MTMNEDSHLDNTQLMFYFLPQEEKEQLLDTIKLLGRRSILGRYVHRSLKHLRPVPLKEFKRYLDGEKMDRGFSGIEIIAALAAICAVMSVVCPFIGQKIPDKT